MGKIKIYDKRTMGNSVIKNLINKITPNKLVQFYQQPIKNKYKTQLANGSISYSQEGEDLLLSRIFDKQKNGFYVDIGAHHPYRFSNTMLFYKKGWRGINVDPLPGVKHLFEKYREEDVTIEKGVSKQKQRITYFQFNEPAYNTFDKELATKRKEKSQLLKKIDIQCLPLSQILNDYPVSDIDFLTIDVEGWELEVLMSIDWNNIVPRVIVLEVLDFDFEKYENLNVYLFLKAKGYFLFSKLFHSTVFIHENSKKLVKR